jgi:predicted GH43/DUF377 family glycosyl hydrolase
MTLDGLMMERLGVVMTPAENDAAEEWGVLNPASARDRNGNLLLFPRLVAAGNYSRIGRARVLFGDRGTPTGVERLGVALEPVESWERRARSGGVEDPRITYIDALDSYVMTYTAYGPTGPRVGLAVSDDLESWRRLGPALFAYQPDLGVDLNLYTNKNAAFFPEPVSAPDGTPSLAMLHRPSWELGKTPGGGERAAPPAAVRDPRPGIWVSFVALGRVQADLGAIAYLSQHRAVAQPEQEWEALKIGAGPPPVRHSGGWLLLYHGVRGRIVTGTDHQPHVRYSAGAMLLDTDDVTRVAARSAEPLLEPEEQAEREGIVPNVVFPTAIDVRSQTESDVYYGMADSRIGVARLTTGR